MNQAPVPRRETPPLAAEFRAAIESPRPERSRSSGRPVVGYFCSYVPPELLLAAGLDPLRLRGLGVEDSSSGDAYLSHLTCSFARQVTAAVLDGVYDFLAGQISVNCCDHLRRANDVLVAKSRLSYHGYLSVPHSSRPDLLAWYLEELARLKDSLEDHFQVQITDEALQAATAQTNRVRERMQKLDALRRGPKPKLSGADLLTAAVAARVLPPDSFVEKADALLAAAPAAGPRRRGRGVGRPRSPRGGAHFRQSSGRSPHAGGPSRSHPTRHRAPARPAPGEDWRGSRRGLRDVVRLVGSCRAS